MKNTLRTFLFISFLIGAAAPAHATTFNDPINTAVNQLRNVILETQWVKEIALAIDRLNEMKTQTLELFRFHSGLDEIIDSIIGDPLGEFLGRGRESLRDAFMDTGLITPQIEIFEGRGAPQDIRASLEAVTGEIPFGNVRPFIPFEEMQVVDAFYLAGQIREAGTSTRDAANLIAEQAKTASPKGAARLQAQGISELMVLSQQNQEVMAKLLELEATQVEQVSREEKAAERERIKFMKDANELLQGVLG